MALLRSEVFVTVGGQQGQTTVRGLDRGQTLGPGLALDTEVGCGTPVEAHPWQRTHVGASAKHFRGAAPGAIDQEEHGPLSRAWSILAAGEVPGHGTRVDQVAVGGRIIDQRINPVVTTEVDPHMDFGVRQREMCEPPRPVPHPPMFHRMGQQNETGSGTNRRDAPADARDLRSTAGVAPRAWRHIGRTGPNRPGARQCAPRGRGGVGHSGSPRSDRVGVLGAAPSN